MDARAGRSATTSGQRPGAAKRLGLFRDPMSVVDHGLKVYGIDRARIADGSIVPRVTAGNTMAPCVVIGERAAEMLMSTHGL